MPGGHVRIFKKKGIIDDVQKMGFTFQTSERFHSIHSPYWWLRCLFWDNQDSNILIRIYKRILEKHILENPFYIDLVDKVFEPYFTSRTQANATGIGLTVCESIARAHDGGIILEPNLPSGTRAVVSFPASTDNEATFEKVSLIDQRKSLSSILILEDDSLIRQLLVANLEREGYEVTEREIAREELYLADELFFSGTAVEITPIRSVDRINIGNGSRGLITQEIQKVFFGLFDGSTPDDWGWLDSVE